jgi:hypothetical protein
VSLSLAGIPGTVKIDRFCAKFRPFSRGYRDVCMRHQDCRRAGTNGRASRRDLGPWRRPFSLPLREAQSAGRVSIVNCERLRTDSANDPCLHLEMTKKRKHSITPAKTTIASVHKEMQKPRLTASVRDGEREQAVPAGEQVPARSRRVRVSDDGPGA